MSLLREGVAIDFAQALTILDQLIRDPTRLLLVGGPAEQGMVVVASVSDHELLEQLDADLCLLQFLVHELLCDRFRNVLVVQLLYDEVREVYARPVDEILLENVVLELSTAHQEALQDQEETLL